MISNRWVLHSRLRVLNKGTQNPNIKFQDTQQEHIYFPMSIGKTLIFDKKCPYFLLKKPFFWHQGKNEAGVSAFARASAGQPELGIPRPPVRADDGFGTGKVRILERVKQVFTASRI